MHPTNNPRHCCFAREKASRLFCWSISLPHAKHICTRGHCSVPNSILSQIHLITGTAIDVALRILSSTTGAMRSIGFLKADDNDDDVIGSTLNTTPFAEPGNEDSSNSGRKILDFEESGIGGVCCVGTGYHKMECEGLGMSGQEQLFLRRVLTGENDHDKWSGFIWRDEDGGCGICRWIHALILCP